MKRFKKCVMLFLSMVMLFVSACSNGDDPLTENQPIVFENTSIVLANKGTSEYSIVIPARPMDVETYAAEQLVEYFQKATGVVLNVVSDTGKKLSDNGHWISLGETTLRTESKMKFGKTELKVDGFKIKRFGNTIVISGYNGRGTLYGTYEFLEHQFGFVPYAYDEIVVDDRKDDLVHLKDFDLTDIPSFESRDMDGIFEGHLAFSAMSRLTTRTISTSQNPAKYGGGLFERWHGNPYDSLLAMLPREKYQAEHPEWYATSQHQFCLTFDERTDLPEGIDKNGLLNQYVKNWQERILQYADRESYFINFSEADFGGYCQCNTCTEGVIKYSQVGLFIRFSNKIIERLEAWKASDTLVIVKDEDGNDIQRRAKDLLSHKDFIYMIMSYGGSGGHTLSPPVEVIDGVYVPKDSSVVPHEKLYVRWTPLMANHYYSYFDEQFNELYARSFKGWQALFGDNPRFMIWDYDTNYTYYFPWFGNLSNLQSTLQTYRDAGVLEMMRESTTGGNLRSMGDLKAFLTAQLMWNVDADITALTNSFMDNFYKEAAPYMREYVNMMRSHTASTAARYEAEGGQLPHANYNLYGNFFTAEIWPKQILEQAMELFDKAYQAYDHIEDEELKDKMKTRILKESVCTRFLILQNYSSYYNINSPKYLEEVDAMERDIRKLGAWTSGEQWSSLGWIGSLRDAI